MVSHPIVAAACDVRSVLKAVADANPTFMSTGEKAAALSELVAAEAQVAELRLRILADAGDLAADTAARDAAGWLAQHTRTSYADARADLRLATALDRQRPVLAAAMREGTASLAQARVIDRALTALPAAVDATTVALAEAHLVDRAGEFGPKELGRIGRRILDVVAPEIAEAAEAARLAGLEAHAADQTRLTMRRLGDGTTRIFSRLPDAAAATRFATYLEAYANPRIARARLDQQDQRDQQDQVTVGDPVARLSYPKRIGQAFIQLLEFLDPTRLPIDGGDATTVVVTVSLDALKADLATADLLGAGTRPGRRPHRRPPHRRPGPPAGVHREDPARRPRRRQPPPRPRPHPPPLQPRPAQGPPDPRPHLPRRGPRRPRHLVRGPPPRPGHTGGHTDLADGVLFCSHHHHQARRTTMATRTPPQRRLLLQPTERGGEAWRPRAFRRL